MGADFDVEVRTLLGSRPPLMRGGANWREQMTWEAKYRALFPRGAVFLKRRASRG